MLDQKQAWLDAQQGEMKWGFDIYNPGKPCTLL